MVLRKSFYIHWSVGRSPRVHEVNSDRDPSAGAGAWHGQARCRRADLRDRGSRQGQLAGWLVGLTLEDEERPDLDLPRIVCELVDVFPDELPGLPPQRGVDFGIELHLGTSPISMTPHRMAPVELQDLRVQLQELLDKGYNQESVPITED